MGGAAFPALDVIRLNEGDYIQIRDKYINILQDLFVDVTCPEPSPEKSQHGDVDIYVCNPKQKLDSETVKKAISATERTRFCAFGTTSYAVPVQDREGKHAQVDVHICKDGYLDWDLWMSGYGDLVQILGVLNRGIGLTMNDKGLNVRVEELESTNKKASMILLSKEPQEVMEFLGLDAEKWKRGFTTQDETFAWCSTGQYYNRFVMKNENADDRARYQKRPMFKRFIHEWIPAHPEAWRNEERCPRKMVLEDAIKHFDKQDQYDVMISAWKKDERYKKLTERIKEEVPVGHNKSLPQTMRGIKRWVTWKNGIPVLNPEDQPHDTSNAPGVPEWLKNLADKDMEILVGWIKANYVEIKDREKRRGELRREQAGIGANVEA
jgi:hypothetical protein